MPTGLSHQSSTPGSEPRLSASQASNRQDNQQQTVSPEALGSEEQRSDTELGVQEHGGHVVLAKPVAEGHLGHAVATRKQGSASRATPSIQQSRQAQGAIGSKPSPGHTSPPASGPAHSDVLSGSIQGTHSSLLGNAQSVDGSQVGDSCVYLLHNSETSLSDAMP